MQTNPLKKQLESLLTAANIESPRFEADQILGYAGNRVTCAIGISIPYLTDNLEPDVAQVKYNNLVIMSYCFETYRAKKIASQNYWNYKHGATQLDTHHLMWEIPFTLMDTNYWVDAPYAHP